MNNTNNNQMDLDLLFSLETTFPEAAGAFYGDFRNLGECKTDAMIFLDTNVLLMPFLLGTNSIKEIKSVYESLINSGRLFVPERAAREYARNRAGKIAEIYASIESKKTGKTKNAFTYPIINETDEKRSVDKALESLRNAEQVYYESVNNLLSKIREWEWADPVSKIYSSLFDSSVFCTHSLSDEALRQELTRRLKLKLPPGYKDSTKDDSGIGDLAIWLSLVEAGKKSKKHAIFVTEETKPDWWQKSNGAEFLPRYELVDEYRRASGGKSLHLIKLSGLLKLLGASTTSIEEAQSAENSLDKIRRGVILMKDKEKARFTKLTRAEQKAELLIWFYGNYADPAEACPYETAEGGYQYIWGGPYDAHEVLAREFSDIASDELIAEVASELSDLCSEWSGLPDSSELD